MAVAANIIVLLHHPLPWLGPVAGGLLLFGLPICLLYSKLDWHWADPSERVGYSLVLTLLLLMGMGLAINGLLPHMGISRPLGHLPILVAADGLLVVLTLWKRHRWPEVSALHLPSLGVRDKIVLPLCSFTVLASITGAIRLNNGAGGGLTLVMLVLAATLLVLLFVWRDVLNPGVVTTAVYCLAAALLLMTALRGWYITGHDIQSEFRVFELTKANGNWSMGRLQDPYNACLSITILPTLVAQMMRIADPYVYKLIFQLIFAYCPVMVYKLARRYSSTGVALLAVVYFISFPTFLNDMPFLNRQELAFLFVAAAFLMIANTEAGLATRRVFVALCSLGVVVSHYSTTYVLVGTLLAAWLLRRAAPLLAPALNVVRRRRDLPDLTIRPARPTAVIGLVNILILVIACLVWTTAYTHTEEGFKSTLSSVVKAIQGSPVLGSRSADVSYGLFSLHAPSEQQVLRDYASFALKKTQADRDAYYPEQFVSPYPTTVVAEKVIPETILGRALGKVGLDAPSLNSFIRRAAARLYQLFLAFGLLAALFSQRRRFAPGMEYYALACGAAVVVMVQVVLPVISINYGILRAFQQALIIVSPFVAFGTVAIFRWLGDRWSLALSYGLAVVLFLSLSGVLPQVLGGYPPQLNLNNAGEYYDLYYVHPQEVEAIRWLGWLVAGERRHVQPEYATDRYTLNRLQTFTGTTLEEDIWPSLLRKDSHVFLGFQTVTKGEAAISYEGDLILYRYPLALIKREKDLIYVNSGAWVLQ